MELGEKPNYAVMIRQRQEFEERYIEKRFIKPYIGHWSRQFRVGRILFTPPPPANIAA
jgi:hypothetical protein